MCQAAFWRRRLSTANGMYTRPSGLPDLSSASRAPRTDSPIVFVSPVVSSATRKRLRHSCGVSLSRSPEASYLGTLIYQVSIWRSMSSGSRRFVSWGVRALRIRYVCTSKKRAQLRKYLRELARPARIERATYGFGGHHSIP